MGVRRVGCGINAVEGAWRVMFDGRKFRNWEERECGRGGDGLNGGRGEAIPRGNGPIRKSDWGREENRDRGGVSRRGDDDRIRETSTGRSRFREGAFREEREREKKWRQRRMESVERAGWWCGECRVDRDWEKGRRMPRMAGRGGGSGIGVRWGGLARLWRERIWLEMVEWGGLVEADDGGEGGGAGRRGRRSRRRRSWGWRCCVLAAAAAVAAA